MIYVLVKKENIHMKNIPTIRGANDGLHRRSGPFTPVCGDDSREVVVIVIWYVTH